MLAILPGFDDRVMTVVTPAELASRAATILVDMPPVPRLEPELDTAFLVRFLSLGRRKTSYHLLAKQ